MVSNDNFHSEKLGRIENICLLNLFLGTSGDILKCKTDSNIKRIFFFLSFFPFFILKITYFLIGVR